MMAASPVYEGFDPDVAAPMRLGMGRRAYRTMIDRVTDALATDDGDNPALLPDHQRASDRERAEWIVAILYAAGYSPRRLSGRS